MGEYARYGNAEIKIGTCEDMYYLRADQAALVSPRPGSLNPADPNTQKVIRFRFPWPDEDYVAPGQFERHDRSAGLYGLTVPPDVEHTTIQFVASVGYLVGLPCPENGEAQQYRVMRNGFQGPVKIIQQAWRNGRLITICACGGCGALYRLNTLEEAGPVIAACRAEAALHPTDVSRATWWHTVADRIAAGYNRVTPSRKAA